MKSFIRCVVCVGVATASLSACLPLVPLMIGGAAIGGGMMATDRRTSGTVLEDEGIELKANSRLRENVGERVHVNVVSYNRQVLLIGEVPSVQDKQLVEKIVAGVENVRLPILNELAVLGNSTLGQRSSDALVTSRVKAALVDDPNVIANAFKIVTERGTVYMMGRVTKKESERATEIVRKVNGVQKVVRVLDFITEDELTRMLPQQPAPPAQK